MSDRKCWLAIAALAILMSLALSWPVWAQETQQSVFCDKQDQVTAVIEYGEEAIAAINKKMPQACAEMTARFYRGDTAETVKVDGKLWDIVPVILISVGRRIVQPTEQWTALQSMLIEATWKPEYNTATEAEKLWFQNARTTPEAFARFGWQSCCSHSDRFVTSFRPSKLGDKWYYQREDKSWSEIPEDIIHWEDDPKMPEQLKQEGVLFIYQTDGRLTCFWPPKTGG